DVKKEMIEPYLTFELEMFDFPLVWAEAESNGAVVDISEYDDLCYIFDPELTSKNLAEEKYRKLIRGNIFDSFDKDLKPTAKTRNTLNNILNYPPSRSLSDSEKNLIWRFRFFLKNNKHALVRFVECVDWKSVSGNDSTAEVEFLSEWSSHVGIEQILELLLPKVNQNSPHIWKFAISVLDRIEDDKILLFVLQLVRAIRYEPQIKDSDNIESELLSATKNDPLFQSNTQYAILSPTQTNSLASSKNMPPLVKSQTQNINAPKESLSSSKASESPKTQLQPNPKTPNPSSKPSIGLLASFLIKKSLSNDEICHWFYWYLMVECESREFGKLYGRVAYQLMASMSKSSDGTAKREVLRKQSDLVLKLSKVATKVAKSKESRARKIDLLREYLDDPSNELVNFSPLPHPLDPKIIVTGVVPSKGSVFKSAMSPLLIVFKTLEDDGSQGEYSIIFKSGDDMRQDQLVLQIIGVIDKMLISEGLDLKLIKYNVLATGIDKGMTEFVKSMSLSQILSENNNRLFNYLLKISNQKQSGEFGDRRLGIDTVMENYVKSCAGYSVITYLLGVGDRHLDNLLLSNDGKLFHVDYGYILGKDPKPFPPPIKLCKEMVEAMQVSITGNVSGSGNIYQLQNESNSLNSAISKDSSPFSPNMPRGPAAITVTSPSLNNSLDPAIPLNFGTGSGSRSGTPVGTNGDAKPVPEYVGAKDKSVPPMLKHVQILNTTRNRSKSSLLPAYSPTLSPSTSPATVTARNVSSLINNHNKEVATFSNSRGNLDIMTTEYGSKDEINNQKETGGIKSATSSAPLFPDQDFANANADAISSELGNMEISPKTNKDGAPLFAQSIKSLNNTKMTQQGLKPSESSEKIAALISPRMRSQSVISPVFGGQNAANFDSSAQNYTKFKGHLFVGFSFLRRAPNSRTLITMLALMGVSTQDLLFVESRLHLTVSEDRATRMFSVAVEESISALFPQVIETLHKWAQYWRN
ncbi:hypothetical protein BB560_003081, partial [Smittium megazygosporum]